ncbi:contractile injection system protein, VgrG/Pvc8 family [Escherichia coli]
MIEYKIQYQESDLDFINRVLSDAGIYYFFVHKKDKHIMTLADMIQHLILTHPMINWSSYLVKILGSRIRDTSLNGSCYRKS